MDNLLMYLQDPKVVVGLLGVCAIIIIGAILKRAIKLMCIILVCGVVVATVKPVTTQLMADKGVSIQGAVITIETENEQHVIDLSMGASIDTEKQSNGDYILTLYIPNQEPRTIHVSKATAAWVKFGAKFINEIEKVGEEIVERQLQ